jgi:hypothetical protein
MINEVKRVRQEDHEFKASLGYTLKKKKIMKLFYSLHWGQGL